MPFRHHDSGERGGAVSEDNKQETRYVGASSMSQLFTVMDTWQAANRKRFRSMNDQHDGDLFCCIALTNPAEVIIVAGCYENGVDVRDYALKTHHV